MKGSPAATGGATAAAREGSWVTPIQRSTTAELLLASAGLALIILLFFYDVVFMGRTLVTSSFAYGLTDTVLIQPPGYPEEGVPDYNFYLMDPLPSAWSSEPTAKAAGEALRDLRAPLWDTSISGGVPMLAGSNANVTSPLRLPMMISASPEVWDGFLLARLFVAGLFTYLLARRLGMAGIASFGAAVAFSLSGYFMLFMNMPNADTAMMIPVLLFAFELLVRRTTPGLLALAAVAVALTMLSNNPGPGVITVVYAGAYYAARAISMGGLQAWRRLPALAGAGAAGLGLTGFLMVPFMEFTGVMGFGDHSVHLRTIGPERGVASAELGTMISNFVPWFHGATWRPFVDEPWTGIRTYSGMIVPLLAIVGFWNQRLMGRAGLFFLAAAVLLMAKWYGVPGVNDVGRLPLLSSVDFPQYAPPLIGFSLAMLAGIGLDRIVQGGWRMRHALVALAGVAVLLGWLVFVNRDAIGTTPGIHVPRSHALIHLTVAAGAAGLAAVILVAARRWGAPAYVAAIALVFLVAAELFVPTLPVRGHGSFLIDDGYARRLPVVERPPRFDPFVPEPHVQFLQEQDGPFRFYGLDRVVPPNTSMAYGLDDLRGYTAVTVERQLEYVLNFLDPESDFRFTGMHWPNFRRHGGAGELAGDRFLDLMNVRYVLSRGYLPAAYEFGLADAFLPRTAANGSVPRLDAFEIDGERHTVLLMHTPMRALLSLTPTEETRYLLFNLALHPEVWAPDRGDGVEFRVSVWTTDGEEQVFSRWIDPKNDPGDQRWFEESVDLEPYIGRSVILILYTEPGESAVWDWAGWGALRLAASPDEPVPEREQFRLVHDGDIKVYEKTTALPRAFAVSDVVTAGDMDEAMQLMMRPEFDPASTAIIEGDLSAREQAALAAAADAAPAEVVVEEHGHNRVRLRVTAEEAAMVVLSDTYYPGWRATVDGRRTEIYPAYGAFRAVFVPGGEHEVEFEYSPRSFRVGVALTFASGIFLAGVAMGSRLPPGSVRRMRDGLTGRRRPL